MFGYNRHITVVVAYNIKDGGLGMTSIIEQAWHEERRASAQSRLPGLKEQQQVIEGASHDQTFAFDGLTCGKDEALQRIQRLIQVAEDDIKGFVRVVDDRYVEAQLAQAAEINPKLERVGSWRRIDPDKDLPKDPIFRNGWYMDDEGKILVDEQLHEKRSQPPKME